MGGRRVEAEGWEEGGKNLQVKTQAPQMVLTTQLGQRNTIPGYTQLVCSTDANVSVMVLQGCKSTLQKSRPIESGHGRRVVQVAIDCNYELSQKMNFNFVAN